MAHRSSEYYTWRMRISRRLIREKGFSFIAVEGDWPDCYRVNRYIKGYNEVWEHNTHIGDARATDMARANMVNVGQIVRERHDEEGVVLVGFGGHRGSVIAGREWGAPVEKMPVPRARSGSWEALLHLAAPRHKLLLADDLRETVASLERRGHRAIGVVYHPEREHGNYVPTILPERYDAFLYFDETEAVHPLHLEPQSDLPPETYPWGV